MIGSKKALQVRSWMLNKYIVVKKSTKKVHFVRCIDNKCGWRLQAEYVKVHSCFFEFLNHDHRQAKYWVVG